MCLHTRWASEHATKRTGARKRERENRKKNTNAAWIISHIYVQHTLIAYHVQHLNIHQRQPATMTNTGIRKKSGMERVYILRRCVRYGKTHRKGQTLSFSITHSLNQEKHTTNKQISKLFLHNDRWHTLIFLPSISIHFRQDVHLHCGMNRIEWGREEPHLPHIHIVSCMHFSVRHVPAFSNDVKLNAHTFSKTWPIPFVVLSLKRNSYYVFRSTTYHSLRQHMTVDKSILI